MNYEDDKDDFSSSLSLRDTRDSYRYDSDEMDSLSNSSSSPSSSSFEDVHIVERLQRGFEKLINNAQDAYTISCRPDYRLKVKTLTPKANLAVKMDIRNAQVDYRLEIEPKLFVSHSSFGEDGIDNKWYTNPVKKIEVSVEEGEVDVFFETIQSRRVFNLTRPEDPEDSKFSFNYRIASRHWDQATKSLRKYEVKPHERVSAAVRWDVKKKSARCGRSHRE
ncbi:unnamed protein product [Bathycoccus prasinos]